jgi:VCBS repeat-containing protein
LFFLLLEKFMSGISKIGNFLKKLLGQGGVNQASAEALGGAALGLGSALNSTNAGGYMNPNVINGWSFNPADGNWYKPSLFDGSFDFTSPAPSDLKNQLDLQRQMRDLNNQIEKADPSNGEAGAINAPGLFDIIKMLPDIYDRYSELWPDIYRDLSEYFREAGEFWKTKGGNIVDSVNDQFNRGRDWVLPRDPLVLDLDGDGIELTGSSNSVLFDHNADGVAAGTQWVRPDDGILVRDINGNGLIDSGRELFGDQTAIGNNRLGAGSNIDPYNPNRTINTSGIARDGFEALRPLDSNQDGVINSSDNAFNQLQVWQDLDQDGISDAGELRSLASLGITQIKLQTTTTQTRSDGSTTTTTTYGETSGQASFSINGQTRTVQNVNFAANPFYRDFLDTIAITTTAQALPDMQGSGMVRDLREAMSLGNAASNSLINQASAFQNASSTQQRQSSLKELISAWGATSTQGNLVERLKPAPRIVGVEGAGNAGNEPAEIAGPLSTPYLAALDYAKTNPEQYRMMTDLERFNGQPILEAYLRRSTGSYWDPSTQQWRSWVKWNVAIEPQRLAFFEQSYQTLQDSTYQALYLQTAGKRYLDQVQLVIDEQGLRLNFDALNQSFAAQANANPAQAAVELAEFAYFTRDSLAGSGWDGAAQLSDLLEATSLSAEQLAALKRVKLQMGDANALNLNDNLNGSDDGSIIAGQAGNDVIAGHGGSDILLGGAGADTIYGGTGADTLVGGTGDDALQGQWGNDTYIWGAGQGNDTITDYYADAGGRNSVILRGLNPADVRVALANPDDYSTVRFTILSTGETLTMNNSGWFGNTAPVNFQFADGTSWDMKEAIRRTLPMPTAGNDVLVGTQFDDRADRLNGGAGNDLIIGRAGADVMEGGAGDDLLMGNARWRVDANGAAGQWEVTEATYGQADPDVYVFGRGDGKDVIIDVDSTANQDVLRFKAGVAPADLELAQRGEDLVLRIRGTEDQITVQGFYKLTYWWYGTKSIELNAIELFEFADGTRWNLDQIKDAAWLGTDEADVFTGDARNNRILGGLANDTLSAAGGNDEISGGQGADQLRGEAGNDTLLGDEGDDKLQGGDGNDVLDGGAGNDVLVAGAGADVIRFGRGDGQDVLAADNSWYHNLPNYYFWYGYNTYNNAAATGNNAIELKAGITPADVKLVRQGQDLMVQIVGTQDRLTVKDFVVRTRGTQEPTLDDFSLREIRFADGSTWGPAQMLAQSLIGDASDETLTGFDGNEIFDGKGGNDTMIVNGGENTVLFGLGDGKDRVISNPDGVVIRFKAGITADDVRVRRVGNTAVFTLIDSGETLTVTQGFRPDHYDIATDSEANGIVDVKQVEFADGTLWDKAAIDAQALASTDGDDVITDVAFFGRTELAGGLGNDTLISQRGDTTFVFNRGDGQDVIIEETNGYAGRNSLRFGADITAADLQVRRDGADLIIGIAGTSDQVTIRRSDASRLDAFEVGGVTLTLADIVSLVESEQSEALLGTSGDDTLTGTDRISTIKGFAGNDRLSGGGSADVIEGGAGNDLLFGGAGDDQLSGGANDDILVGDAGRDSLSGDAGANVYRVGRGTALDAITLTSGENAVIELGAGVSLSDLSAQFGQTYNYTTYNNETNRLVIGFGGNDAVVIHAPAGQTFDPAVPQNITLRLADGTQVSYAQLMSTYLDEGQYGEQYSYYGDASRLIGSQADDRINANYGRGAFLDGRGNNDELSGNASSLVSGGDGDDRLSGGQGSILAGGRDSDEINGYDQAMVYAYNRGDGQDRILGSTGDGVLSLGAGLTADMLRLGLDASTGELIIRFASQAGDEIRTSYYNPETLAPSYRALQTLQFIDATGGVTQYNLGGLLADPRFTAQALLDATPTGGLAALSLAPAYQLTGTRPVAGGQEAMAYAQGGDFFGAVNVSSRSQPGDDNLLFGTSSAEVLDGAGGNDVIYGLAGNDRLIGGQGDDWLDGGDGADQLIGGAGDDTLIGGRGNDRLQAGTGNNKAYGGIGSDTYLFARGDGQLSIEDSDIDNEPDSGFDGGYGGYGGYGGAAVNELVFGAGIRPQDLSFAREGDNLIVTIAGAAGDVITLKGFDEQRPTSNTSIQRFVFAAGETIDLQALWESGAQLLLVRGDGFVSGGEINERLEGGLGADFLAGGAGNDILVGGAGSDAYLIGRNTGRDTIIDDADGTNRVVFDTDVNPSDVSFAVINGVATIRVGSSSVVIENWDGLRPQDSPIQELVFADGMVWSMSDLFNRPRTIRGTPQDDVLTGTASDDIIEGLGSNDLLLGGTGADTYVVDANPGHDTIRDVSSLGQENTLAFTSITASDIERLTLNDRGHLVIRIAASAGGGSVTLENFDRLNPFGQRSIEFFRFADGQTLTHNALMDFGFVIEGTAAGDVLRGTALSDTFIGGAGDDLFEASAGSDQLFGGAGDDIYEYRLGDGQITISDRADATGGNVLRFGEGITAETLLRKLRFSEGSDAASSWLSIGFDENNSVDIQGFDRLHPQSSQHGIENFEFADGTVLTWNELLDKIFVVEGDSNADTLLGTSRSDRLYGYDGNDVLQAEAGDDVVTGGTGNDQLEGGAGRDNYVFALGDGADTIRDSSTGNTISMEPGITAESISISRSNGGLLISYGSLGDTIFVENTPGINPWDVIEMIELADGQQLSVRSFLNAAPVAGSLLVNQTGRVGDSLSFVLPQDAFSDPDGDALSWSAQLGLSNPLPEWLSFDPNTRSFSGTPPVGTQGRYEIVVFAADSSASAMSQRFVLDVSPRNATPDAMNDSASLNEDATLAAMGNVLSNDQDADVGDTLTVSNPGQYQGRYGVLTLAANGSYSYVLNNVLVQSLGVGASVQDQFGYQMSDGQGGTDSATLTVTIDGRNDLPVALADSASATEDQSSIVTGNVLSNDSDVDQGDSLSVAQAGRYVGRYGVLTVQTHGAYQYELNTDASVQSLGRNTSVTDSFALNITDGTATVSNALAINISGTNDGPVAQADVAAVVEDGIVTATGNVLTNDRDIDVGDVLSVANAGTYQGTYGSLVLEANGSYSYSLNNNSSAVQNLRVGQQVNDVFTVTTSDGSASTTASLTITVTGSNDAPIVQADVAAVSEDGTVTATGNVLTNDRDNDAGDVLTVANAGTYQGTYGSLILQANGSYSYSLNNSSSAVQSLRAGQQVSDVFTLQTTDGTATVASSLTLNITGSNDAPIVQADVAAVAEDGVVAATGNVLTNDRDTDIGDVLTVANAGTYQGTYGQLVLQANGSYTYSLNNSSASVQSLRQGQQVNDVFTVTTSDGTATANANLTITVTGSNDAPIVQADVAAVAEDGVVTATGNVLTNDRDTDVGSVLSVANAGTYQGSYGSLVLQSNGSYTYTLSNSSAAVQSLAAGQQVADVFAITTSDGTATVNANLSITVTGSNDAPTLQTVIADQAATANQAFTLDLPDTTFKDIDQGDVLTYSVRLSNGTALPTWLSFNPAGLIFTGTPPTSAAGQSLEIQITATDRAGASASDIFKISIGGGSTPGLTLIGTCHDDRLVGGAGNDTIDGRQGSDTMIGGAGDDLYYVDQASSRCEPGDIVTEYLNQGYDRVIATVDYVLPQHVEALSLGGSSCIDGTGNSLDNWLTGNSASNNLDGKDGNDLISAGAGDDCVYGGTGNDILEGQDGNDWLEGGDGRDALFGGAGNDTLKSNNGRGLLAGGRGNDTLYAGSEATEIAFNKGDGCDTLYLNGASPITLSLGGGLKYEDVRIRRSGSDLFFDFNSNKTESLRVVGYYSLASNSRPSFTMQMLTQASGAYNPSGSDTLRDNQVELFDATKLIKAFDTAYAGNSGLRNGNAWAIMNNLLDAHLGGSNTAALGGDLAYQFGSQSSASLAGMGMAAAGSVISDANFVTGLQTLNRPAAVGAGPRLAG